MEHKGFIHFHLQYKFEMFMFNESYSWKPRTSLVFFL